MSWDGPAVLYAAARWVDYLAAFVFIGVVVFRFAVWPRAARGGAGAPPPSSLGRLGLGASLVLLVTLSARLYWQARSLADPDEALTGDFLRLVLGTGWGQGWMAQVAAAGLGLLSAALISGPGRRRLAWGLASLAALAMAGTAPWTGHAVAVEQAGRFGWLLDAVHFGAGATWLGTLAVLVVAGLGRGRSNGVAIAALVAAFSPVALAGGLVTMGAGLVMGYRYLGGVGPLFDPGYGRALTIKLLVLALLAGMGAYHWRVGLPRLRRSGDAGSLRKTALWEVGVALLLLAVTAVLVALPLPGEG